LFEEKPLKGVTTEVISEVRSRADILEVVSEVVVLKRTGKAHKGLCPFHPEKTPSFNVTPERGIYKCFGCGEAGDVFAFVQKVKGLNFLDAVRELAHKYGVQLVETETDRKEYDRRSLFLMLYQQACEYYRHLLKDPREGQMAREYLERRGITEDIIEKFQLGFAPNVWDGLLRYLGDANKVSADTLVEAGLVRHKPDTDKYYDLFRNRLMIPIQDDQGRVIAFGGRTLGDDQIKYLNSPETPIYTKGDHLFAFNQAKEAIKAKDSVLVVEGYFDAITPHQHGFDNTVATLGTALTERQAKLLVRYTDSKRVYLCFDADVAGERAVDRGMETMSHIAEGIGIELRVVRVPGGKDPDECLRSGDDGSGALKFGQAIATAPLLIDYQLQKAIASANIETHTGRIQGARLIVPILAGIKNAVARGEYIRTWAVKLAIREEDLLTDVGSFRRQNRMGLAPVQRDPEVSARAALKNSPRAGHVEAERQLLALYLSSSDDHADVREKLAEDRFIEPAHQRIKEAMEGIGKFNSAKDFQERLQDRLCADAEASKVLVDVILKVDEVQRQNSPRAVILKEARARILCEKLNQEKVKLRALLPQASTEDEQMVLQSRIMRLKQLETQALPTAQTEEQLDAIRQQIDSLLLETT
jgi:DNA primase